MYMNECAVTVSVIHMLWDRRTVLYSRLLLILNRNVCLHNRYLNYSYSHSHSNSVAAVFVRSYFCFRVYIFLFVSNVALSWRKKIDFVLSWKWLKILSKIKKSKHGCHSHGCLIFVEKSCLTGQNPVRWEH